MTLGLVISAATSPYSPDLLPSVETAVAAAGYALPLIDPHHDPRRERDAVMRLHHHRVDGVLLSPTSNPGLALNDLTRHDVPTVLLDRLPSGGAATRFDQVGAENADATYTLTHHLVEHGHTRLALLAGSPRLTGSAERRAGFRRALQEADIQEEPALIVPGGSAPEPARAAMRAVLEHPQPPTAVVAGNSSMALGALAALRDADARSPDDVAIGAFDDCGWANYTAPRLTVMARRGRRRPVRLPLRRHRSSPPPAQHWRVPRSLVVRESCGCTTSPTPPHRAGPRHQALNP